MRSDVIYDHEMPNIMRWLGGRRRDGHRDFRMHWGSVTVGRGWAFELCLFEQGFAFRVHALRVNVYLNLPMLNRWRWDPFEIMESWGAACGEGTLHLHWGRHTKVLWIPWRNWVQVAHDVRQATGNWTPFVGSWERGKAPDRRHVETLPYRYMLRSGEVQARTAAVSVERRVRRLRMLRWLPWFQRTTHAIDVTFSDEVGERSGSWKGGCIGCGYELKPGETAPQCLKRMETERRF